MGLPLALSAFTIIPLNYWLFGVGDINLVTWLTAWLEELGHLWFLWQLLLLAGLFMLVAKLGAQFRHAVWWLLVPLVAVPLFWMEERSFGADGSSGMLPDPKVLGYYALFFLFGSFLYQRRITMHRWWALFLLPALTVVFLSGVVFLYPGLLGWQETVVTRMVAAVLQAAYAWLMSFGMIGLFRLVAAKERDWVRYLSDASYWLTYVTFPWSLACRWCW